MSKIAVHKLENLDTNDQSKKEHYPQESCPDKVNQLPLLGKIAIYMDSLQGYGADKTILKIVNGLAEQGVSVDLVLAKKTDKIYPKINSSVNLVYFSSSRFNPLKNVFCLTSYLIKNKPEILFSSIHFNNIICVYALELAKLVGVDSKLVVRQANRLKSQLKGYPFPIGKVMYPLISFVYKKADLIICPSKGLIADLTEFMKVEESKIKLIYNPTITADIFEKSQQKANHEWLENKSCPVIVGAGRLKPQKDFTTLIKAFAQVKQNITDAKLIILGEGPQRKELENLITQLEVREDVDLIGFQENPYAFVARSDVFVLSSRYEGLPNILIEALALGKKIVATNCNSGPAEILQYGKYGGLVPIGSPVLLADAITASLEEPDTSLAESKSQETFVHKTQVKKYITTFLSLSHQADPKNSTGDLEHFEGLKI